MTSMVSNKQEINSVTFPSTHTHLFSVGFFKNDIGSSFFVLTSVHLVGASSSGFSTLLSVTDDENSNMAPDSLLPM